MRVTFLGHSGFLVELRSVCLLFDWWKGELPPLPDKPLTVLVSHRHPDHFSPRIFQLDDGKRNVRYLLAQDLRLNPRHRERWGMRENMDVVRVGGGETLSLPGMTVETLCSTDAGVAFLITADGRTVYHAGDLNWWHWDGEDPAWNRNMEVNFKRYLEPLSGRHIDLAFAPLDPRLERSRDWGFRYLLESADVTRVLPMHQWDDPEPARAFCCAYPALAEKLIPVDHPGQTWEFQD
jgi:glyoxylase-like metal-dependent hydrolase (beta-lactamase superfamily II)